MFGKGKINIVLQKTHYAPGEVISGKVDLVLKKAVRAREATVSLVGEQITTRVGGMPGSRDASTSRQRTRVYEFKQRLDAEREYGPRETHAFEVKIPADILTAARQMPEVEGRLGQGLKIAQAAATITGAIPLHRTKWYLLARLDVPGGLDVKSTTDVTIG